MSDYRRFISYIYLYDRGLKAKNTGFARVESRNGQCRIQLQMPEMRLEPENTYEVFMLISENGGYIGADLGSLSQENNGAQLNFVTRADNLAETGYSLDRCSGMAVLDRNGRIYGTRWDDEPLNVDCFKDASGDGGKVRHFQVAVGTKAAEGQDVERVAQAPEPAAVRETTEAEAKEQQWTAEQQPGNGTVSTGDTAGGTAGDTAGIPRFAGVPPAAVSSATVPRAVVPPAAVSSAAVPPAAVSPAVVPPAAAAPGEEQAAAESEFEKVAAMQTEKQKHLHGQQDYRRIFDECPQMYPFEDNVVDMCVRLELQDIGRLPISCWCYGSNSFLMHGYYCYRHLIFARLRDRYILGVPGIQRQQESFIAAMFGFRHFKPVGTEGDRPGAFGYWYTFVK